MLLVPLLFFGGVEWALRAAGVGTDPRYFVPSPDGERWRTNHDFGRRFFSSGYQIHPEPLDLPREKPPDELRIVLLGGSAAYGDLDWGYGVGRFLEAMLRARLPDRSVRVVSGALPGANSHLVRLVARDAAALEPDLLLLYVGNNEVVGPFGVGSIVTEVGNPDYAPRLPAIRTNLWLTSFRLGQVLASAFGARAPEDAGAASPAARPERPIRLSDPRLATTRDHLRRNLDDLLGTARNAGIPVLVSTVPVNLRDSPPLRALHAPGLGAEAKQRWQERLARGRALAAQGRSREALAAYDEAGAIDDSHAELAFERARAFERASRPAEALAAYVRARDLDALRARADSETHAILRRAAEDADAALADVAADWQAGRRAPGLEDFYDHCHLTLEGNHRLAAALFPAVLSALGPAVEEAPRRAPGLRRMRAELGVTAWDRYQLARRQSTRGLFPGQLRPAAPELPSRSRLAQSRGRYVSVLALRPEDLPVRERLAELRLELGDAEGALADADVLLERVPDVPAWLRLRARARLQLGQRDQALADYDAALALDPQFRRAREEREALVGGSPGP